MKRTVWVGYWVGNYCGPGHQLVRMFMKRRARKVKLDFIAKMSIAHKEARESAYWLRLFSEANVLPAARLHAIQDETDQITKIISSILITSKQNNS